jgi:hypothetical protein
LLIAGQKAAETLKSAGNLTNLSFRVKKAQDKYSAEGGFAATNVRLKRSLMRTTAAKPVMKTMSQKVPKIA